MPIRAELRVTARGLKLLGKLSAGPTRARAVAQTAINSTLKRSKPKAVRAVRAQIFAIVDAMPEPQRSIATEALYAPHYSRNSPMLAVLAQAMGWSSADVDERFAAAAARVV